MKTKELPKEFTFICDEHSREQLEKLGIDYNKHYQLKEEDYGDWYEVENKKIICEGYMFDKYDYPLINLSDYIDQPNEQKWQDKTRGGYEYHIYEEFEGEIFGRIKINNKWVCLTWNLDGKYHKEIEDSWDLLPFNQRRTEIEQRLSEIDKEREKLQNELNNLK